MFNRIGEYEVKKNGSVIWITGLSGAGKTSVGKLVSETLRNSGVHVFWMDGDEMRQILGNKWGYSVEDRIELAQVYSRIAAKMADSGITVVCSVVALFDQVREWNRANIENYLEVFLRVPISVLADRDSKGHYQKYMGKNDPESVISSSFQLPNNADLIIDNFGVVDVTASAHRVLERFLFEKTSASSSKIERKYGQPKDGIKEYWDGFYSKDQAPRTPSSFAEFCKQKYIEDDKTIFEIGCGNGRDTFYFAKTNSAIAIDASDTVIEKNKLHARQLGLENIEFVSGFFGETESVTNKCVDYFYSRFVLHAMDEYFENSVIALASKMLISGGLFLAEFRTTKDPLSQQGVAIGQNERITDHYRRFIDAGTIVSKLGAAGFEILYSVESNGLAIYKDDDPVVARIIARII